MNFFEENRIESYTFENIPESIEEFKSLKIANLDNPFKTAALTVVALFVYPKNKKVSIDMLNFLRGPRPLNGQNISFLDDRFREKSYIINSYFEGATPENDYKPNTPYKITIEINHISSFKDGYKKLFIPCGGADDKRAVTLRMRKTDKKWFLWEQNLTVGITPPKSLNPWS